MSRLYLWLKRNYRGIFIITIILYMTFVLLLRQESVNDLIEKVEKSRESLGISDERTRSEGLDLNSDTLKDVGDDDPKLIEYLQTRIIPPPQSTSKLKLADKVHSGQIGQAEEVLKYFNNKKNGIFVEAGAWNGEYLSNTLYLEVNNNWTGLLVEPNSGAFNQLVSRNRQVHCVHSCLSVTSHPDKVEFDSADVFGGININLEKVDNHRLKEMRDSIPGSMRKKEKVECYPLYSLFLAVGITQNIDFLSLDIEGAELAVLKTIPWDKVRIELVMIEINHSDKQELTNVMTKAGYKVYKNLKDQDIIYRRKS